MENRGFTLIEMIVVVSIITTAILGMGASAGFMIRAAATARLEAEALQSVEGRISQIVMDPRYASLESLYSGSEAELPGLPDLRRLTQISWIVSTSDSGGLIDYKVVMVSVTGPDLQTAVSRTTTIAAP